MSGSYESAFVALIVTCLLAAVTFFGISRYLARKEAVGAGAVDLLPVERG
jgi:hypothetical protein